MRKHLCIGLVVTLVVSLCVPVLALCLSTTLALANGGPHEGAGFGTTPDGCAGCHRAHTAVQGKLLNAGTNQTEFCYSCHSGSGADTDVQDGQFLASGSTFWAEGPASIDGRGLRGGGMDNARMITNPDPNDGGGSEGPALASSKHNCSAGPDDLPTPHTATIWGYGNGSWAGTKGEVMGDNFECVDCHNPHGNDSYRMLRPMPKAPAGYLTELGDVDVADTAYQYLYGTSQIVVDEDGDDITTTGLTTPANSIDGAFDDDTASNTAVVQFGDVDASWEFEMADPTSVGPNLAAQIRLYASGHTDDTILFQVYDSGIADWVTLDTFDDAHLLPSGSLETLTYDLATNPYGDTEDVYSVDQVILEDLAEVQAAKLRLVGTETPGDDNITLYIDGVRLLNNVTGGEKSYSILYTGTLLKYRDTSYAPVNITAWCSQCHTEYMAGTGAGSTPNQFDYGSGLEDHNFFAYRHYTDGLAAGCLKCHLAHGTSATMDTYSNSVPWPGGVADTTIEATNGRSSLLHYDNRGTCTQCHTGDWLSGN